jgi:hypothetical protein
MSAETGLSPSLNATTNWLFNTQTGPGAPGCPLLFFGRLSGLTRDEFVEPCHTQAGRQIRRDRRKIDFFGHHVLDTVPKKMKPRRCSRGFLDGEES